MTRFDRLGEHIAREQDALRERAGHLTMVRERLRSFEPPPLQEASVRAWSRRHWIASGVGFSLALTGLLFAFSIHSNRPSAPLPALALFVGPTSEPAAAGRWVEAPAGGEVAMRFSDGSHIEVAELTRARVVDMNPAGADVLLESGLIHVQVRHRAESAWHISAGPFGVRVTGTRFDVRWKPEDDAFELTLKQGQVELTGCVFGQGYRMQAGYTVRASCRNERFEVSQGETAASPAAKLEANVAEASPPPSAASSSPPVAAADAPLAKSAADGPLANSAADASLAESAHPVARRRATDWQALARASRFAEALSAAKASGFASECNRAGVEELALLADLARYGHDTPDEARALRLLRTRFAGTKRASLAAFALGKLEFDDHGSYAEAAEWFRVYLRERPKGELSREANGRLLEATLRSGRSSAARDLALQYLRDYPNGPHADLARSLVPESP
ncbi:MAG TPA: FecR family protein [Polyangiales bacterium]